MSWVLPMPDGGNICLHLDGDLGDLARLAAGQRVRLLVEVPRPASTPTGGARPLAKAAGIWCRDRTFVRWLMGTFPGRWRACRGRDDAETAAKVVRLVCGVASRAELDTDERAAFEFHRQIRRPYNDWLRANAAVLEETPG